MAGSGSALMPAAALVASRDVSAWRRACTAYDCVLEAVASGKKKAEAGDALREDDRWLHLELPHTIRGREPAFITAAELSRAVRWKLALKFSIGLQQNVDKLSDEAVRAASQKALEQLDAACAKADEAGSLEYVRRAFDSLTSPLKGVGPGTASVIFSIADPTVPYMSEEAAALLMGEASKLKYNVAEALALTLKCRAIAHELNHAEPKAAHIMPAAVFTEGCSVADAVAAGCAPADVMASLARAGHTLDTGSAEDRALAGASVCHPLVPAPADEPEAVPHWTAQRVQMALWAAKRAEGLAPEALTAAAACLAAKEAAEHEGRAAGAGLGAGAGGAAADASCSAAGGGATCAAARGGGAVVGMGAGVAAGSSGGKGGRPTRKLDTEGSAAAPSVASESESPSPSKRARAARGAAAKVPGAAT